MKRLIFMSGVAAAVMSCGKAEVLEFPDSAVVFENVFVSNLTRADLSINSLESFTVFGRTSDNEVLFEDTKVSRAGGEWLYPGTHSWDRSASHSFAAYAPCEASDAIYNLDYQYGEGALTFDYDSDADHQHDLLVADAFYSGTSSSVSMDFRHMLSILSFVFTSEEPRELTFNINSVKVNGVYTKAHFNGTCFEDLSAPEAYPVLPQGAYTCTEGQSLTAEEIYVIPQAQASGAVSVELDLTATDSLGNVLTYNDAMTVELPEFDWRAGKTYEINIALEANDVNPEIKVSKIEFSVSVEGWKEITSSNQVN